MKPALMSIRIRFYGAGHRLRVRGVEDRVDADEPAQRRVVLTSAEVGQAGRVQDATDEALVARPCHERRAVHAERVQAPTRHGQGTGVSSRLGKSMR